MSTGQTYSKLSQRRLRSHSLSSYLINAVEFASLIARWLLLLKWKGETPPTYNRWIRDLMQFLQSERGSLFGVYWKVFKACLAFSTHVGVWYYWMLVLLKRATKLTVSVASSHSWCKCDVCHDNTRFFFKFSGIIDSTVLFKMLLFSYYLIIDVFFLWMSFPWLGGWSGWDLRLLVLLNVHCCIICAYYLWSVLR